jgi:hypothetical protein
MDGGQSWSPTVRIDSSEAVADQASIAPVLAVAPDGTMYAAWWSRPESDIRAAVSLDRGASWGDPVRVNPTSGTVLHKWRGATRPPWPAITVDPNGRVFVAWPNWTSEHNKDVLVAWSDDRGVSWSSPVRVNDAAREDQWMVALAADRQGALHAAWYDSRTGNINLVYATSTDRGRTWSTNLRITTESTAGPVTRLGDYIGMAVADDGTVYLVWTDGRGADLDIYFAASTGF